MRNVVMSISEMPKPSWSAPDLVARFASSPPNPDLMKFAEVDHKHRAQHHLLDIGCGAGCNAVPLAKAGWTVLGLDLSEAMLEAAGKRAYEGELTDILTFQQSPMDELPVEDNSFDFIVAHGIWNLARSDKEFRKALHEAARVARHGASLFVYTFSRSTLPVEEKPVYGESFVYTGFSGAPQCFLTEDQLIAELAAVGFTQEPDIPIVEYPRLKDGVKPAIYEGIFWRDHRVC